MIEVPAKCAQTMGPHDVQTKAEHRKSLRQKRPPAPSGEQQQSRWRPGPVARASEYKPMKPVRACERALERPCLPTQPPCFRKSRSPIPGTMGRLSKPNLHAAAKFLARTMYHMPPEMQTRRGWVPGPRGALAPRKPLEKQVPQEAPPTPASRTRCLAGAAGAPCKERFTT